MAASRSSSVSDENGICRDYLWGICNMGTQCIYGHVFLFEAMKEALKFCHDYQNRTGCTRPDCTYLHTSREEENLFLTTGRIPRLLLDRYARMSYNMTDFDERAEFAPSPMEYKYEYMEQPPPPPPAFPPPSSIINSQSQQMQANLMVSCTQFPMQRPMAGPMQGPPPPPPPLPPPAQTGPMQVPIQGPMAGPMQGPPPPPPPLPPPAQTGPMQVLIQGPMAGPMQGPPPPPPPLPPPAQTGPMQVPIQGPMAGPMQGPPPPPPPLPPPSAQTRSMCPYPHQDIQVLMSCPIQGPMAGPLQRPMSGPMQGPPPPPLPPPSAQTRPIQVPMSCPRQGPMAGPAQGSIAGPIQDPMQGHIPYCMPDPMQIQLQYPIQYPQRLRTRSTPMSASMPHPPPPPLPATSVSSSRTCAVHAGHPTTSFNYQPATNQQSFPVLFNPTRPPPPLFQNQLVYKRSADEYEAGPSKLRKLDPSNGDCSKCTEMTIRCKLINLNTDALKKLNAIHQASVERKAREIEQKKKFVLPMLSPEMWLLAEQYVIHVALECYIYQHHQRLSDVLG